MGDARDDVWHAERDGRAVGPFDTETLLARRWQDAAAWRVWKPGMAGWRPLEAVFSEEVLRAPPPVPRSPPPVTSAPPAPEASATPPDAPAEAAADAPSPEPPRRYGYFARHWRGDLGLGTSVWVNGLLVNVAAQLIAIVGGLSQDRLHLSDGGVAAMLTALSLTSVAIGSWQAVGIWRSSRRHVVRGGKRVWAAVAKLVVVLSSTWSVYALATQSYPIVHNAWSLARQPAPTAHALRRGTEIEFAGGIRRGAAAEVLRGALDAAPAARVLHLDSPGGDLAEAAEMAAAVRRRGLATYVRGECLSACTVVFLAGSQRLLRDGAKLGFHRPWTLSGDIVAVPGAMAAERARLAGSGLPPWFVDRVLATPAAGMWFPTDAELSQAGLLARRFDGEGFSPGRPRSPVGAADMAGILRGLPMAAALERGEPAAFDALLREVLDLARDGGTRGELVAAVQRAALPLYAAGLRSAPDAELVAMARAALPAAEALAWSDPGRCEDWLVVRRGRPLPDVTRLLGDERAAALATAAAAVMGAASGPALWIVPADAVTTQGPPPSARASDAAKRACSATIGLVRDALDLPEDEAASALRRIVWRGGGRSR